MKRSASVIGLTVNGMRHELAVGAACSSIACGKISG